MTSTSPALEQSVGQRGPALLRPLRLRDFRLLFAGESISMLGDQFHFVALAWLTLQLTGSGLALGGVLTVAAVPRAIFMLLGGALSDRLSPRTLMFASNGLRAVVVGIVAALVLSGRAELWQLYILAAVFGVVDAFFYPAMNTMLPMLVGDRQLPPANALVQGTQQLTGLIGPAVAGVVIAAFSTGPAFAFDAISFAIAATALLLIRGGRRAAPAADGGVLRSIGPGLRYAWSDPAVRSLVLLTAAVNFAITGPTTVGVPVLVDTRLGGGSAAFGIILAGFGAGALVGAIAAGAISRLPRLGLVTLLSAVGIGIGLGMLGSAPNVPVAAAITVFIGLLIGFINVRVIAWLQARTPEALRGRVMSLVMLGSVGLGPISLALAGVVADLGAVPLLFGIAGAIVIATALVGIASGVPARMTEEAAA
ncbi:MAG: MFS transporter [Chloroflexota bacterium]